MNIKVVLLHYVVPVILCFFVAVAGSKVNDWVNQIHNDHVLLIQVVTALQGAAKQQGK